MNKTEELGMTLLRLFLATQVSPLVGTKSLEFAWMHLMLGRGVSGDEFQNICDNLVDIYRHKEQEEES